MTIREFARINQIYDSALVWRIALGFILNLTHHTLALMISIVLIGWL
jgi:hypothetical protein